MVRVDSNTPHPVSGARARRLAVLLAAALIAVVGCDRNTSEYVEGDGPQQPDLSRIFPDTGEHDHADHAAEEQRESVAQETSRAGSARGPTISGEVRMGAADAPAGATLFVIARKAGVQGGPPLAVVRVPSPSFPFAFELSQADVMIKSLRFDGEMSVTARLDTDGNAMTRAETDLEGASTGVHSPGDAGVVLTLE